MCSDTGYQSFISTLKTMFSIKPSRAFGLDGSSTHFHKPSRSKSTTGLTLKHLSSRSFSKSFTPTCLRFQLNYWVSIRYLTINGNCFSIVFYFLKPLLNLLMVLTQSCIYLSFRSKCGRC